MVCKVVEVLDVCVRVRVLAAGGLCAGGACPGRIGGGGGAAACDACSAAGDRTGTCAHAGGHAGATAGARVGAGAGDPGTRRCGRGGAPGGWESR